MKRSELTADRGAIRDESDMSELALQRLAYAPVVPSALESLAPTLSIGDATTATSPEDEDHFRRHFKSLFESPMVHVGEDAGAGAGAGAGSAGASPLRIGVLFCGRQSPGGHNVLWALHDAAKAIHPSSEVIGFLDGTVGMFAGNHIMLTADTLRLYKNQGGFDLLARSVDQIRTEEHRAATLKTCNSLALDGLVLIGGSYTLTDAAYLAEYLKEYQTGDLSTKVVGIPGSIDGDLKNEFIETTFGFDTACKVYSQLVGNMATDGASAAKYYYIVRLMGRKSSHITLEVALKTHPNLVLLGEEMDADKISLNDLITRLANVVVARREKGKNFGMVLVPEGLIMHIPELVSLIDEMNALFARNIDDADVIAAKLTPWSRALLDFLPPLIRKQLFSERESHGTVQLSQISTESLIADLLAQELEKRKAAGTYPGGFAPITHFFGYQARCSLPSNFDCNYAYSLGVVAASLVRGGHSGYAAVVRNLEAPAAEWKPVGVPLTAMMSLRGSGRDRKPVIPSVLLDVGCGSYRTYKKAAEEWAEIDDYVNPGPIQFRGPTADVPPRTVELDRTDYLDRIDLLNTHMKAVSSACRPGVSDALLDAALIGMDSLTKIIEMMKRRV